MNIESLKQDLLGLKFEIIDLNQLSYFYVRKRNRLLYVFTKTGREFMLEESVTIKYLENGIILHLTNLDDDNSKYSFRSTQKLINKSKLIKNQKHLNDLKKRIDSYRKNINILKTQHRNERIAHINSIDSPDLMEFLNFEKILKPLIKEANEIADFIWGEEISVKFKLGSMEGTLDFRKLQDNLNIDISKITDIR